MKTLICFIAFLIVALPSVAQSGDVVRIDNKVVKDQVKAMVEDYQYQLYKLANGTNPQPVRNTARDVSKALFMEKGGKYSYKINGVEYYDRCIMETVNKYRPENIYKKLVANYLDVLAAQPYRTEITGTKEIAVDNPKKISKNRYVTTAYLGQKYIRYYGDNIGYIDQTYKKITVYIDVYPKPGEEEYEYVIRLEDCSVEGVEDVPEDLQYD